MFKFLLGISRKLDEVRGRLMGTKPLRSLREAFFEARHEYSRKKVIMGTQSPPPTLEGSALVIQVHLSNHFNENQKKGGVLGVTIAKNQDT